LACIDNVDAGDEARADEMRLSARDHPHYLADCHCSVTKRRA
jgi:hypothetical protein